MAGRSWTLLVVPHGSESPRSYVLSERLLRAALWTFGSVMVVAIAVFVLLVAQYGRPTVRSAAVVNLQLRAELRDLDGRLASLHDTLHQIEQHDERLRVLAGLPSLDSTVRAAGIGGSIPSLSNDPLYHNDSTLARSTFATRADLDAMIHRANVLSASFAEITDTLRHDAARFASMPSIMPTAGWLSSEFSRSRYHPILHINRPHEGIDVAAPYGTPIVTPADGVVITVTQQNGYGNVLEIDHGNGIVTKYAHCSRVDVKQGQHVKRGQVIGAVGNSGLSTGPHLHYEIHVNGRVVDPLHYILPSGALPD